MEDVVIVPWLLLACSWYRPQQPKTPFVGAGPKCPLTQFCAVLRDLLCCHDTGRLYFDMLDAWRNLYGAFFFKLLCYEDVFFIS